METMVSIKKIIELFTENIRSEIIQKHALQFTMSICFVYYYTRVREHTRNYKKRETESFIHKHQTE